MSRLEDRIRDAYRAADSWGPEELTPLDARVRAARGVRVVVPALAAMAVLVILAGVVVVADRGSGKPQPAKPPYATGPKPHFYVAGPKSEGGPAYVADARTGKQIARVPGVAGGFWQVASAGDNRTFVLSAREAECRTVFYRLRLRDDGRVEGLWKLAATVWGNPVEYAFAMSRDGRKLAYVSQGCGRGSLLDVIDLVTGARSTWTTDHYVPSLSWTANGRLAFSYYLTGWPQPEEESGVFILDPASRGGALEQVSRKVSSVGAHYSAISPDGHTVYVANDGVGDDRVRIETYSTATGRRLRQIFVHTYRHRGAQPGFKLLKLDGTNRQLLFVLDWKLMRISVNGGRAVRLPANIKSAFELGGDVPTDFAW